MFIRNKKIYLICLLISIIGTVIFWVFGFINNDIVIAITSILLVIASIAGLLCGSLGVYWSLVKFSCRKGNIVIFFLPWLIIYWFLRLVFIAWAIILGLALCLFVPGVFALIAWFRHRYELI